LDGLAKPLLIRQKRGGIFGEELCPHPLVIE
jgi:hypothetical protein